MAITNGNSPHKVEVYESMYLICQATQQITEHLERLRSANVLARSFVEVNKTAALQHPQKGPRDDACNIGVPSGVHQVHEVHWVHRVQ